jgi:SNF2 family DNA or RNA helicase
VAVKAWVEGARIHVRAPYAERFKCAALAGRLWDPNSKSWHVPATPASAANIVEKFEGQQLLLDAPTRSLWHKHQRQLRNASVKEATELPDIPGQFPAWLHQRRAFHFVKDFDGAGEFMDMGTGKSKVAIALLEYRSARRVLVLGPRNVIRVWPKKLGLHALTEWKVIRPPERSSVTKRASYVYREVEFAERSRAPYVVLINYEAAWRKPMDELILGIPWDEVIADESHKIAAPGGRSARFVGRLHDKSGRRDLLTGTPFRQGPHSIYGQYRFAEPGIFGTNFTRFRARYCLMGGYEQKQIVGYQNEEELSAKIGSISFIVKKGETELDLPEELDVERECELAPAEERTYQKVRSEFLIELESGALTIQHGGARILRLQQATSGHLPDVDGNVNRVGETKARELEAALDELDDREPVVVFTRFVHDLDEVREVAAKLGRRYGELSGRRDDGLTQDATMNPDVDVLGVQIQAGGVGIDLTRACYGIYYSVGYDLLDYDQSRSRLHRPGQTRPVTFIHLIATLVGGRKTVDRAVYTALREKKDVVEYFLDLSRTNQQEE